MPASVFESDDQTAVGVVHSSPLVPTAAADPPAGNDLERTSGRIHLTEHPIKHHVADPELRPQKYDVRR
jgi:hypothetical protein